ncbi:hypothetical protein CC80DRAFT_42168 [Byssothecium circinans]|uniref:Uncharacterized protein n=1 Tax=Byssothecium circinans TaxID=147558 RepID=A0A6A5TYA7_9PLEO|nr:hypothetical protein CC80DRAFT_42168 [Byssothecium circinans]
MASSALCSAGLGYCAVVCMHEREFLINLPFLPTTCNTFTMHPVMVDPATYLKCWLRWQHLGILRCRPVPLFGSCLSCLRCSLPPRPPPLHGRYVKGGRARAAYLQVTCRLSASGPGREC